MNYDKILEKAKLVYENEKTGHDFSHIERVLKFCKQIHSIEGGNWDIIYISTLFHDVHRVLSNVKGKFISAEDAMVDVKNILSTLDIDENIMPKILYIIENHDNKETKLKNMPIELAILQDADILDAIGKVGLKRTLTYCKTKKIPLVDKSYDLNCKEYIPNIFPISTTHYVYRTMLPNVNLLHTKTAKKIAKSETRVLKDFVKNNLKETE